MCAIGWWAGGRRIWAAPMVKEGGLSQSLSRFFCFVSFCFFLKVAVSCDKLFLSKERQHLK